MERAIKKKNCNTKPANAAGPIQHQRGTTTSENRTSLATKGFAVIHVGNKEGQKPSKTLGKQNIDENYQIRTSSELTKIFASEPRLKASAQQQHRKRLVPPQRKQFDDNSHTTSALNSKTFKLVAMC